MSLSRPCGTMLSWSRPDTQRFTLGYSQLSLRDRVRSSPHDRRRWTAPAGIATVAETRHGHARPSPSGSTGRDRSSSF